MTNFVDVTYQQTGKSLDIDSLGMREMQRRAFEERNAQYLLLKAPPASGKSRALRMLDATLAAKPSPIFVTRGIPAQRTSLAVVCALMLKVSKNRSPNLHLAR